MALGAGSAAPVPGAVPGAGAGHAAAGGYARMRGAAAGGSGASAAAGTAPAHARSQPARSIAATVRASIAQCAITSRRGEPVRALIFTALAAGKSTLTHMTISFCSNIPVLVLRTVCTCIPTILVTSYHYQQYFILYKYIFVTCIILSTVFDF